LGQFCSIESRHGGDQQQGQGKIGADLHGLRPFVFVSLGIVRIVACGPQAGILATLWCNVDAPYNAVIFVSLGRGNVCGR